MHDKLGVLIPSPTTRRRHRRGREQRGVVLLRADDALHDVAGGGVGDAVRAVLVADVVDELAVQPSPVPVEGEPLRVVTAGVGMVGWEGRGRCC